MHASDSGVDSSISIGSAASVAGNLLSGVFKKLTPAEKEAERKLEEAPSEDAAAAWAGPGIGTDTLGQDVTWKACNILIRLTSSSSRNGIGRKSSLLSQIF